jgi:hypothetical protein
VQVGAKARANLARLTPAMRKLRPDYAKFLNIVGKGNLQGLLDTVTKTGGAIGFSRHSVGSRRAAALMPVDRH